MMYPLHLHHLSLPKDIFYVRHIYIYIYVAGVLGVGMGVGQSLPLMMDLALNIIFVRRLLSQNPANTYLLYIYIHIYIIHK